MIRLQFSAGSRHTGATLGPAPWFQLVGALLGEGPHGRVLGELRAEQWIVRDHFFTGFECGGPLRLRFEGTLGAGEALRVVDSCSARAGTLYTPDGPAASYVVATGRWLCHRSETTWPVIVIETHEPMPLGLGGRESRRGALSYHSSPTSGLAGHTVLVVEDEDALRGMVATMLRRRRYGVLEARTPKQAIALAATARIDLLLTDVVMPEMAGPELAASLITTRPGLSVIYMSGYHPDEIARQGGLPAGAHFLAKPFTLEELITRVRRVLHRVDVG